MHRNVDSLWDNTVIASKNSRESRGSSKKRRLIWLRVNTQARNNCLWCQMVFHFINAHNAGFNKINRSELSLKHKENTE